MAGRPNARADHGAGAKAKEPPSAPRAPETSEAPKPAARTRRARALRMTREGKWFIGVTLGVGFAAVNTGNNLIYLMLGLMLSLIVLSSALSEMTLRRVRVKRQLPVRAFAGSPTLVEIVLTNDKRFAPSLSLEVEDIARGMVTERRCYFLKVAPGGTQIAAYRRTPKRRGVLELSGFRLATRYPFGFFEKSRHIEASSELLVYPALVPASAAPLGAAHDDDDGPDPTAGPGAGISGLREHRDGDDARDVHWPKSASIGRMVVRERERDARPRLFLRLDNAEPRGLDASARAAWSAAFESAVSQAASLAAVYLKRGVGVGVVTRGACSPLLAGGSQPDPIWRFLALVEPVPANAGAPPFARARGSVVEVPVVPEGADPTTATEGIGPRIAGAA